MHFDKLTVNTEDKGKLGMISQNYQLKFSKAKIKILIYKSGFNEGKSNNIDF